MDEQTKTCSCDCRVLIFLFALSLLVFLRVVILQYEPYTFLPADDGWMATLTTSLVEDGDFDMKNQLGGQVEETQRQIALGKKGEWYSIHEYLISVAAVPFYLLFGINGFLVFNVLCAVLGVLLVYQLVRPYSSEKVAFLCASLLCFTTVYSSFVYHFSIDIFAALLFLWAVLLLFRERHMLAGFVWGLAVLGRLATGVTFPAVLLFLFMKKDQPFSKKLFSFCLGGLPFFLIWSLSNHLMFGGIFETSYSHWALVENNELVRVSQTVQFHVPFFEGLGKLLFDPQAGVFVSAPLLILALFLGFKPLLRKARAEATFIAVSFLCFLGFYAKLVSAVYTEDGNRFFIGVLMLFALPLAAAIENIRKP